MAKFEDLNIDSITNANGVKIPFVIVFTFLDEYVETFKRPDKAWKSFDKQYKTDSARYTNVDDVEIDMDDDEEPYKDKLGYALITKESLSAISEDDKVKLEFGIRIVDSDVKIARVFDKNMIKYYDVEKLTSGIEFDDVESTLNEVMEQTKQLSVASNRRNETKKSQEENKVEETASVVEDESQFTSVKETQQEDKATSKKAEPQQEPVKKEPPKIENTEDIEDTQQEEIGKSTDSSDVYQALINHDASAQTPLDYAKADLLHEIKSRISPIHLPSMNEIPEDTLDSLRDSESYDKLVSLKRITEDKLIKRNASAERMLNAYRDDVITSLFNKFYRRLNVENDELLRKRDFTSSYSPFNETYRQGQSKHQQIIDALPETKHEQVEKNRRNHEAEKQAYIERAMQNASQEFDDNRLHLVEDNAQKYIDEIKEQADKENEKNKKVLEQDADSWYATNFNTLVPKIIQSNLDDIEREAERVTNKALESIENLNKQAEEEIAYLSKQFQDITYKEIETNKNNESLVEKRVFERTSEYPEFEHKISELEKDMKRLTDDNNKTYEELQQSKRDLTAERKRNEGLEEALRNRNIDLNQMSDNYRHLENKIASGHVDELQVALDKSKYRTLGYKIKQFGNIIASGIIGLALILSALLFGGGGDHDDKNTVTKQEMQQEVQKAVKKKEHEKDKIQSEAQAEIDSLEEKIDKNKPSSKSDKKSDKKKDDK
ncbi:TPA_asm: hypothetical protein GZX72_14425 [Listeria monocytogenes]|nr:hypothetical protein [Listeria monocytogenes]